MSVKYIYHFNSLSTDGDKSMSELLGGKGANLAEMCKLNLPVPAGFTITTDVAKYFYKHDDFPENFESKLIESIKILEKNCSKNFEASNEPLLVSVRSGAKASMPGMMDSILNLGMSKAFIEQIKKQNSQFWLDNYARFLASYKLSEIGEPYQQLIEAIKAVIKSWYSERAIEYRFLNKIDDSEGTAVNIQQMVYGNKDEKSGTGVLFTRSPATGENKIFGEFILGAQGEDIVAGTKTPLPIEQLQKLMPDIYEQLIAIGQKLEQHYKDIQDIEFTIEQGKLYILQTRSAKRTIRAAIKVALDLVDENIISEEEALLRIDPDLISQLLHDNIDYKNSQLQKIGSGLPASPGATEGIIVLSAKEAEAMMSHSKVILFRRDTSPEDIRGMYIASAIVTARGGMTSHAAVVARGMGRPCICGVEEMIIDVEEGIITIGTQSLKRGDKVVIDGTNGQIFLGEAKMIKAQISYELSKLLALADKHGFMQVRTNAETKDDIDIALSFDAIGVGLCRTEHMFFEKNRLSLIRQLIIAASRDQRELIIAKLLPYQINDFKELFRTLKGRVINIRLLDPPLHEFLPMLDEEISKLGIDLNISVEAIYKRIGSLHEVNPMLGHRGCRLAISYPEIYQMQIEAIFIAAAELEAAEQIKADIEIMIPFVVDTKELIKIKAIIAQKLAELNYKGNYKLGTMIELPRAALLASEIAVEVDFFSFGTNDLTQTTYGLSRDDASKFMKDYLANHIFDKDPFVELDPKGVGQLIAIAAHDSKKLMLV